MNYEVNKLYGILTDGDTFIRNTTMNRKRAPKNVKNIVEALIPPVLDANTRRALAEFYLRMIFTDKPLIAALTQYDPINSYQLHSFYPEYADTFDIDIIVKGVKKLGLPDEEVTFLPLDYIMNALRQLIGLLNG